MMGDFILGYLLNAVWQAPLIAAAAFLLLRFARLDARERCWMGLGFVMLAAALPAMDPRLAPSFDPPVLPEAVSYAVAPDLPASSPSTVVAAPSTVAAPPTPEPSGRLMLAPLVGVALQLAFLASIVVGAVRLAMGLRAARRLVKGSRAVELPAAVLAPMRRLATAHGRKAIQVRASDRLSVPAVVGGWAPIILAPADFERHGQEAMTAALLHECAHVVRGDYALNLLCEILTLPLIWHPAVHLLKSQIQADREAACDQLASSQMPAKRYASCLVALAEAMTPAPRLPLAMQTLFGRGELERRVRMLLQTPIGKAPGRLLRAALVGGPMLGALVASGLTFHVEPAMAQAAVKPVSASPAPPTPAAAESPPAPPAPAATDLAPATSPPDKPATRHIVQRHVHRWTSDDGKTRTLIAVDEKDLTPEDQASLDREVTQAKAEADRSRAYVHSPEFHDSIVKAERDASSAAAAAAHAEAEAARAEARAHGEALRVKINEMMAHQKVLIDTNRYEIAAQVQRVKDILHDPEVKQALEQAKAAGPEVRRALDRLDRELDRTISRPPSPPIPPSPPAPPEPPSPPEEP